MFVYPGSIKGRAWDSFGRFLHFENANNKDDRQRSISIFILTVFINQAE
jgi:hypothetical protein